MWWSLLRTGVALAWIAGCRAAPEPRPAASVAAPSTISPHAIPPHSAPSTISPHAIDDARNLELGRGVARDYRAAAQRYARACDAGHGDPAACAKLDALAARRRGVEPDDSIAARHAVLCARGVASACITHGDADTDVEGRPRACADDNWLACGIALEHSGCALQPTEACFAELARQGRHPVTAFHSRGDTATVLADARRLIAACDDGEVDACEQIPGREVPLMTRCRANDFAACHLAACEGDAAAVEIDRAHPSPRALPCADALQQAKWARQRVQHPPENELDLTGSELPALADEPAPASGRQVRSRSRLPVDPDPAR